MSEQLKGFLITSLGVLLVVPDSLFVRLIDAPPMIIAFWRGAMAGGFIFVAIIVFQGASGFSKVLRSGLAGWLYIFLIGSTTPAFVLAISHTTVANAVFILATTPVFASILSFVFLRESIGRSTIIAILFAVCGVGVIALGSNSSVVATLKGDLWALYVAFAYAAALTAVRKVRNVSMIPAIPIAYLGVALFLGIINSPLGALEKNWHLFFMHGAFIALATCLLTIGPRYLTSPEVSLLILLESVLAPILIWLVMEEYPGKLALVGGTMVIIPLLFYNFFMIWVSRTKL